MLNYNHGEKKYRRYVELVEKRVKIVNPSGMHAKASAHFISFVFKYKSDIKIISGTKEDNAKSILNLIMLSLNYGDEVILRAEGKDEQQAVDEISAFMENMRE